MRYVHVAIALSVILLSSYSYTGLGYNPASAVSKPSAKSTLSLDSLEGYPVTQGTVIIFSGKLIEGSSLEGIPNTTINIIQTISYNNEVILVAGLTDEDGVYSIPWIIDVEKVIAQIGGSSGSDPTVGRDKRYQVEVRAQFDGDENLARSTSNSQSFEVRLNQIKTFVDRKTTYLAFESATIQIRITDVENFLIDPDKLTAFFDNKPITLVRDNQGIYSFGFSYLAPGSHLFKVTVQKNGFITDEQVVTIEAMKRKTSIAVNTDKLTYQQGKTVNISAKLVDTGINEFVLDKPVTASIRSPSLKVRSLTLVDGEVTYRLGGFDEVGKWIISANFVGDNAYFSSSNSLSFTVDKFVEPPNNGKKVEKGEVVSLGRIKLMDQTGSMLRDVSVGQQVMIEAKVTSKVATDEEIAYISLVKDADGITIALSWITGTVSSGQFLELAVSWLPDQPGEYTVQVFVWKNLKNPEPLTFKARSSTIVVM